MEKDAIDEIELRSESVQDILRQPPNWMLRWGNAIIFIVLLIILVLSYIIKYPEFIPAPITITSQNPPQEFVSTTTNRIEKIFIKNHQEIKKGQIMMIMESSANQKDVMELKKIIDSLAPEQLRKFPIGATSEFKLGEIQQNYNTFIKAVLDEESFNEFKSKSNNEFVTEQTFSVTRTDETNQEMANLRSTKAMKMFAELKKSLKLWEQNYVIVSSSNGIVNFQKLLRENQLVNEGEVILYIIPEDNKSLVGRVIVPANNSGKIIQGQKVLIKLENYQFQEFGIVEGKVENVSFATDKDGNYHIDVSLPKGLKTSYNKNLIFDKELKGTAEIVTQDLRFIERLFYQIRKLF